MSGGGGAFPKIISLSPLDGQPFVQMGLNGVSVHAYKSEPRTHECVLQGV